MFDPEFVNIFNKLHVFISLSFYSLYNISIGGDNMFHFAIVDNSQLDIDKMKNYIEQYCLNYRDVDYHCDVYTNSEDFPFDQYYDAIFLDIKMPHLNGLEFASKIKKKNTPKIIFMTSNDNFMKDVFDYRPFNFIHKNDFEKSAFHTLRLLIDDLLAHTIKISNVQDYIPINHITYIDIIDDIVTVHDYKNLNYTYWKTLKHLAEQLTKYNFILISQSTLINMNYIKSTNFKTVLLDNGKEFQIAYRKRKAFKNIYQEYKKYGNL